MTLSKNHYKFFIIAGEASGDLLGSKLIEELKKQLINKSCSFEFIGIGGKLMQEQGLETIFAIEELSLMGFVEILPHIPKLIRLINFTAKQIIANEVDAVISIDAPDFSFRVMNKLNKFLKENKNLNHSNHQIKKIHLIAPSVWAYRKSRARKIAKIYNLLLAILPFEPPYFEKFNLKTIFIGHPIIENTPNLAFREEEKISFYQRKNISPDNFLMAITAGSRNSEVLKIFPQFIETANQLFRAGYKFVVALPVVTKTHEIVISMSKNLEMPYFLVENKEEKHSMMMACDIAICKSGTNSLEFSLYQIPIIIGYKINYLSYLIVKMLIKIKFANIINLIANQEIIPEAIQQNCSPEYLLPKIKELLTNKNFANQQIKDSQKILKILGLEQTIKPTTKASIAIIDELN
ncbi:MAG: lipid-A-disaccharide synthase [Rickettsiales bacterium]|jgi:lipid-A-disaccharide synthase|nr:lipid-A-disaccharide synthase [Rickettsiales bacterium]